jgi:hypothetical protein
MKKLLTVVLGLVVLSTYAGLGVAQEETKRAQQKPGVPSPEITSSRITAAQIARVQADPLFKAAMEFLEEQGEVVNLSRGQVLRSRSQPGITEYSFDVTMRGSAEAGEYAKLVYSEQTGQPAFVYFDDNRTIGRKPVAPQPSEAARGAFCFLTPWGPWQVTSIFCKYNFWCFSKNQQALYLTETRQKTCPDGTVKTQTRTVKVHCGC